MGSKSHTLFHFTDSLDTLFKILSAGFWPKYCAEDFRWYNEALGYVSYPIVSFCDIPLTRINEHTDFYGKFGIGMSRAWAVKAGLNPVIYLTERSPLRFSLLQLAQPEKFVIPQNKDLYVDHFFELLSLVKPISGRMPKLGGGEVEKDFCLESEWRYSPQLKQGRKCIPIQKHNTEKAEFDRYTFENCLLKLEWTDIEYLIVESNEDCIAAMSKLDQLEHLDPDFTHTINLLKSKIISLECIARDF